MSHELPEVLVGVGAVDSSTARLWFRLPHSGDFVLCLRSKHGTHQATVRLTLTEANDKTTTLLLPDDVPGVGELQPLTQYVFTLSVQDRELADGRFETAPKTQTDAPEQFSVAVASCHMPFDAAGRLDAVALELIDVVYEALEKYDVKRVFFMGDQVYGDLPAKRSLFDPKYLAKLRPGCESLLHCSRQQVRELYHERYRAFWSPPAFKKLQSRYATHMILDDHEIVDNFGSDPTHSSAEFAAVREGAVDAFWDYQAQRQFGVSSRPDNFDQVSVYGPLATYILDIRSNRRVENDSLQIYSDAQLQNLKNFLEQHADLPILAIGLSVPILHVPDWLVSFGLQVTGWGSDIADRWSHEAAKASREKLLEVLHHHQTLHPKQRMVIFGGDVHIALLSAILHNEGVQPLYQLISSALSNRENPLLKMFTKAASQFGTLLRDDSIHPYQGAQLVQAAGDAKSNPYGGLNVGIMTCERHLDEWTMRFRLLGCTKDGKGTRVVFESERL